MKEVIRTLALFCALLVCSVSLHAMDKEEMLEKARSYIGNEHALDSVKSLRYVGAMYVEGKQPAAFELTVKKPYMQRMMQKDSERTIISATNGNEGFTMFIPADKSKESRLGVLSYDKVQDMMISAMENLYFFEAYKKRGGSLVDGGVVDYKDEKAYKLTFVYPKGQNYVRYFNPETGELIATQSKGLTSTERDYMEVEGIRFPRKLATYKDGELLYRVEFNRIEVNPNVRAQTFEFPSLSNAEKVE